MKLNVKRTSGNITNASRNWKSCRNGRYNGNCEKGKIRGGRKRTT